MDDIELQIRKEFIAEASEMLEAVEGAFIELEKNPEDGKVIDRIFRLAHTIKGSALSCGFTRLGEFAHVFETLLVRVREKRVAMTPEVVDLLLRANDRLRQFVTSLGQDPDAEVETSDVEFQIQIALEREGSRVAAVKGAEVPAFGFFDEEPAVVQKLPPRGEGRATLDELCSTLAESGMDAYVELVRFAQSQAPGPGPLKTVMNKLEAALEQVVSLRAALREAR